MKMTLEEAETKKAYCGRCKHWRLLEERDCEDFEYKYLRDNITRDDCAKIVENFPPCVLGVCTLTNAHNFADEMCAGDDGTGEGECIDWELWGADDEKGILER